MRKRSLFVVSAIGALALVWPAASLAGSPAGAGGVAAGSSDTYEVGPLVRQLPLVAPSTPSLQTRLKTYRAIRGTVGEVRKWVALDDAKGRYYLKDFTLRAVGTHAELWLANDVNFPAGDCRNDGTRNVVSDAQLTAMLAEFDTNMYPKESAAFSVPPSRDGTKNAIGTDSSGSGGSLVILVDNVRDDNYYDTNNASELSYIAGFFSPTLNEALDRNVMTIDAYDWLHRTGATPPDNPAPGNSCTSAPARPRLYEGTFAHEYQHLLQYYVDPDEVNWVNEGLSDWAQTLTGYVHTDIPIQKTGFDSHIQCFLGWLGTRTPANPNPRAGGPENSLTRWGDRGDGQILCDYGAAYSMMEFLAGRYGTGFMSALHKDEGNGLAGLQNVLTAQGKKVKTQDVIHDWELMAALDGLIDKGAKTDGVDAKSVTAPTLHATVNWDAPDAYSTPGAPSNGADFVRLRNASSRYLTGKQITSLSFQGASTLPPMPVAWTVDAGPPGHPGDAALSSGADDLRDEAIVRQVTVPGGAAATLAFDAFWNEEEGWDYGFVQISTDGGGTYRSVACTDTTSAVDPNALPTAQQNLPGFTGYSGGWRPQTCSLSAYAGQTVLLAFRAFNDPATLGTDESVPPGFWVDNIRVGGTTVSDGTTLDGWRSPTQVKPISVAGFTVYILSIKSGKQTQITVRKLKLTGFATPSSAKVDTYVKKDAAFVGAIVIYDDPTETSAQYAPYTLTANGVAQPGGA